MTDIRPASQPDAEPICAIYNHYVASTTISFEEAPVSAAAMAARIADVTNGGLPWLVLEVDGVVAGYAYATKWRARPAYRHAVESSVYLDPALAGRGHGRRLYTRLLDELRIRGLHTAIAGIAQPNERSIGLHERLGFRKVAHFGEVGFKFGRWIDVGYWQLLLDPPAHVATG
ncbi:arsinothricin resistance N-acetyltransferase ArsN1 family B [Telluria beijingensis]|uniref:arsinothricin resistance N-acetyltransferase ArsN1 family B n=1 Tax=Telluria beijingensis TaxID=3068633 RepID=UPI0027961887|nr:arsinothricin resistance N-acetyltransferase ArsN1 family B [Massilia sp. REN29]